MIVSLAALPKGHVFAETRFELTPEWVSEYVAVVEDGAIGSLPSTYPPLALAVCSIRALLDQASLPDGAIHVGQELGFSLGVEPSETVVARARIASRGERQGWVLMGIELAVEDAKGGSLMNGRATITFPGEAEAR